MFDREIESDENWIFVCRLEQSIYSDTGLVVHLSIIDDKLVCTAHGISDKVKRLIQQLIPVEWALRKKRIAFRKSNAQELYKLKKRVSPYTIALLGVYNKTLRMFPSLVRRDLYTISYSHQVYQMIRNLVSARLLKHYFDHDLLGHFQFLTRQRHVKGSATYPIYRYNDWYQLANGRIKCIVPGPL